MSKSLYEIGRAGLHQFVDALAEIVNEDVEMTPDESAGVPMELFKAETMLLATWDEICGIDTGEKDRVKE